MRLFTLVVVHNRTWQLIVCNILGANIIITYAKIEITCSNVSMIKDAVEENYESEHDSWLIDYAVPSLALSHLCKKYQIIYKSVHSYLCTCMRNKCPCTAACRSELVSNVHIQVMLRVISFSIQNVHELVQTWLPEAKFLKFPDWQSNVHFPWPNELTIWPGINGFQIAQSKLRVPDTDDAKQKISLFFSSGKICLVSMVLFFFFLRHPCPVHKINSFRTSNRIENRRPALCLT